MNRDGETQSLIILLDESLRLGLVTGDSPDSFVAGGVRYRETGRAAFLGGAGNGRGLNPDGGGFKTSIRFTINPETGRITGRPEYAIGKTMGIIPGTGALGIGVPQSDGNGGWLVAVGGSARQVELPFLGNINFNLNLHIAADGDVTIAGGTHDGYPSYEVWAYPSEGGAELVYNHDEGHLGELYGRGDVTVPDRRRP